MDVELANKLKDIQQGIESNQNKQTKILSQALNLLTDYIANDVRRIATLESDNRYNNKVLADMDQLKAHLKTYKKLFWSFVAALIASVIIYLMLT